VRKTVNQGQFSVLDGQQRLTTVSLIVQVAMHILQRLSLNGASDGPNQQRLQQLRATYTVTFDPVTLTTKNMLWLNCNNRNIANAPFPSNWPMLAASAMNTTRQLAQQSDTWSPESLASRQAQMSRAATGI
jgi:hypothetical protein